MAERRAGSGGTSTTTKASFRSRDNAPLAAAANSARQRRRRALCVAPLLTQEISGQTPCRTDRRVRILGGYDVWRIDGLLTQKRCRNGYILKLPASARNFERAFAGREVVLRYEITIDPLPCCEGSKK